MVAAEPSAVHFFGTPAPRLAPTSCLPFRDGSFDLIASVLALHWTADLPGALAPVAPGVAAGMGCRSPRCWGGQTLVELRTALFEAELAEEGGVSPRVSPAVELGRCRRAAATRLVSDAGCR